MMLICENGEPCGITKKKKNVSRGSLSPNECISVSFQYILAVQRSDSSSLMENGCFLLQAGVSGKANHASQRLMIEN